jgi:hypothetical protein
MSKTLVLFLFLAIGNSLNGMENIRDLFSENVQGENPQENTQPVNNFCTICQEVLGNHQTERVFSCSHSVHNRCYRSAIDVAEKSNEDFNCPNCRKPVMTTIHLPAPQTLALLWAMIRTNQSERIERIRDDSIRSRCKIFENMFKGEGIKENDIVKVFQDSMYACSFMPLLPAILSQRSSLDTQLADALDMLNFYENQNINEAHLIKKIARQATNITTLKEKLGRKKQQLKKEKDLTSELFQSHLESIRSKTTLELGLSASLGIITGFCVRNLFANEESKANKSAIAAALGISLYGAYRSFTSLKHEWDRVHQIRDKHSS